MKDLHEKVVSGLRTLAIVSVIVASWALAFNQWIQAVAKASESAVNAVAMDAARVQSDTLRAQEACFEYDIPEAVSFYGVDYCVFHYSFYTKTGFITRTSVIPVEEMESYGYEKIYPRPTQKP